MKLLALVLAVSFLFVAGGCSGVSFTAVYRTEVMERCGRIDEMLVQLLDEKTSEQELQLAVTLALLYSEDLLSMEIPAGVSKEFAEADQDLKESVRLIVDLLKSANFEAELMAQRLEEFRELRIRWHDAFDGDQY